MIKETLFKLVVYGNLTEGKFNYDSEVGKYQIKDCNIKRSENINNLEIIDCEVDGVFYNCLFLNCKITNSHIHNCNFISGNEIKMSKVVDTEIHQNNTLEGCYIDNKNDIINGELIKCIIRNGAPGSKAKLTDTEIV